ncbi:uncharacterized protein LOC122508235 [Leptopilina heterotoma]|uniref:uncharacterized protein LOC122508235 n=1 Tax=Leptopilina heterotoma TaxID=63436 RepID=UPI001CA7D63B|nr:uncharacterized protein LOC122508235 [Leptopilina heterotoma]
MRRRVREKEEKRWTTHTSSERDRDSTSSYCNAEVYLRSITGNFFSTFIGDKSTGKRRLNISQKRSTQRQHYSNIFSPIIGGKFFSTFIGDKSTGKRRLNISQKRLTQRQHYSNIFSPMIGGKFFSTFIGDKSTGRRLNISQKRSSKLAEMQKIFILHFGFNF